MSLFIFLVVACGLSALLLAASVWWYLRMRRRYNAAKEAGGIDAQADEMLSMPEDDLKQAWLSIIDQQLELCVSLMEEQRSLDEEDLILRCWHTFLVIERSLIESDDANVEPYLEQFEFVLDRLQEAQEIDILLKQLSVSNSLLKQLNKVVQKTGDAVFEQMDVTANLNLKLDKLQAKLKGEQQLDHELADIRAELASMYELAERFRAQMENNSKDSKEDDEEYLGALSEFLGGAGSDSFLTPIRTELDEKVEELQHLSDYRSQVISELKSRLKSLRESSGSKSYQMAEYDVAFARMEKSLLESNKVIKSLEHKLESLQTIKYNLNVDVRKREEELKAKDAALKATSVDSSLKAQEAIAREQSSVNAIADFMDKVPLDSKYSEFEEAQSEKLATLQQLVSESELYVNVLERDLEKEKAEHEQLLARLEQGVTLDSGAELSAQEQEEFDNLEEVNAELEHERKQLLEQLSGSSEDKREVAELQKKIEDLDMKIETVQANYVNMEERYLNSLMS